MMTLICFTVISLDLNPVCSSASSYSTLLFNRLRMILGWLIRLMVWLFSHLDVAFFRYRNDQRLGSFIGPLLLFWKSAVIVPGVASPLCLMSSKETLSTQDFHAFRLLIASCNLCL
ncbi:hypothetical protein DPMN_071127 [Dreissena polymorpha]|uniref:Uncharacterized protein n=1 Tax=Dreissena polymorpha TaxID=45954 RepID=A0A9D3Z1Q4_DREPO|nr:hypothetical protein DPMN_071127 [Dreissena polymorpha]